MRFLITEKSKWHRWFAWHPVIVHSGGDRYLVWLEPIYRKCSGCFGNSYMFISKAWNAETVHATKEDTACPATTS